MKNIVRFEYIINYQKNKSHGYTIVVILFRFQHIV